MDIQTHAHLNRCFTGIILKIVEFIYSVQVFAIHVYNFEIVVLMTDYNAAEKRVYYVFKCMQLYNKDCI